MRRGCSTSMWRRESAGGDAAIDVRVVTSAAERDGAYAVRRRVFQDEQRVPAEIEFDADDDVAVHMIAQAAGGAVLILL